ncbi:MAG: ATP-binding protein [Bacteroidota bacterium]
MFLVGSVQDISKDRLLTEALTDKNLELERSNAELASFSYIASHDLQEPLRKIQSFSKFLLDMELTDLSGTAKDYFSRIISAAERMQKLIDDLLSYSRSSHSEIKLMPADLNLILEEVKNNLHEVIEEKKVIIETDVLPVLPVIKPQFIQLFSNLISNAIKFSHPHIPPHIRISSCIVPGNEIVTDTVLPQNGEFWKLRISDNGIGFDQKYEHKIFELFQRLHGRSKYEGTGIGLAICKKIVHNHKGAITATGQPGNGAVFTVFLPI